MTKTTNKTPVTLDDISEALIKALHDSVDKDRVGEIHDKEAEQKENFNPSKWYNKEYFGEDDLEIIKEIARKCENKKGDSGKKIILRDHIFTMAKDKKLREVFLASMIWGHGKVGYGPFRVGEIIKNSPKLSQAISESYKKVKEGKIEDAYNEFASSDGIKGLGPAFFTKYLFFIGEKDENSELLRPLILDSVMIRELEDKGVWEKIESYADNERRKDKTKEKDVLRYMAYVEAMNFCAKNLSVDPGDLEYFLFERQGRKQKINKKIRAASLNKNLTEKRRGTLSGARVEFVEYEYPQLDGDLDESKLKEIYKKFFPKEKHDE